jgi:2-polyprenyl-6-methoxyphenol hydroxylase-like FAD-dependent oxidoreductase
MNRTIVVGAGPAGLTLALQLARGGQAVTLVEANPDLGRQFRGDALMPSGLEAIARMGLWPLLERLPQRPLEGWGVWLERQRLFAAPEPLGSLQPCRLVPQGALLAALLEEALRNPNLQWLPGQAVRGLLQAGRVQGVQLADGQHLEADLVVACDGRASTLRGLAGLELSSSGQGLELLWFTLPAADGIGPDQADPAVPGFMTLLAGGAIGSACRGARGELQLAWLLERGQAPPRRSPEQWAEALAQLAPEPLAARLRQRGAQLSTPLRVSVQVGLAPRWWRPGLLLLGDAAHPMSPVRAQGINMALRDSLVAAQELLAAQGPAQLDGAAARIQRRRLPEIRRMQALQSAEARQGALLGHSGLLRRAALVASPLAGPLALQLWRRRQGPLRDGLVDAL